jgi:hypothetical protein
MDISAPLFVVSILLLGACNGPQTPASTTTSAPVTQAPATTLLAKDVTWAPLNPARGDAGPAAANLWGDRRHEGASGFLVRFADGFASPPHIHNVSYRGVVVHGLVHNDDPSAPQMWMPTGSFWTQPKGGSHITSASSGETVAYIEIDEGPYLVKPVDEAFTTEEQPVNVDASRIAWFNAITDSNNLTQDGPKIALLWGDLDKDRPGGMLVKLPSGATIQLNNPGDAAHAVVIKGGVLHQGDVRTLLQPGSYMSLGEGGTTISCEASEACTLYVRAQRTVTVSM